MKNFNEIINILKNNDPLLNDLIEVHFHKLDNNSFFLLAFICLIVAIRPPLNNS